MANTVIQLKKSGTPTSVPTSLANGELALNFADGIIYYKSSNGAIAALSSGGGQNYGIINANGTLLLAGGSSDKFTVLPGNFITITGDAVNDTFTIGANVKVVYDTANQSYAVANAAFDKANNALPNTTGAVFNGNLNIKTDLWIGNNITNVKSVIYDTSAASPKATVGTGELVWNPDEYTLDLGVNTAILQIGQEMYYRVKNQTGSTILNGTVVMAAGTLGASGRILITPAISNGTYPSKYVMGITTQDIPTGGDGFVTAFGKVRGLDTSMWSEGDILYANASVAGAFQNTMPVAPNTKTTVAIVISKHATTGTLFIRPTYGSKLNEDELVELNGLANGDILTYITAKGRFENSGVLVSAYNTINAAFGIANTGFDKANSANVLAYNTGIGANNYAGAMANASNGYTSTSVSNVSFVLSSNMANNALAANNYAGAMANSANAYATTVGAAGNAYATVTGASANNYAAAVGTAGNTYAGTVGAASNTYAGTVGTSANAWASATFATITNTTAAFAYANGIATNAVAAFAYANGVATNTTAAFALANTHATAANATAAFAYANGVATNAVAAFAYANGVATNATSAFAYANGVATNTTAAFALANTHATAVNATAAFAYANGVATNAVAAFAYANGVATNAVAAFGYANGVATNTTAAFAYANGVATNTTAAFSAANNANTYASSTYVKKVGDTITGDLVVQGNLTTSGVVTYANTQTLLIGDAIITLNNDIPPGTAPSEDAGIEIKRGASSNVSILWREGNDNWTLTKDGTTWYSIATNTDIASVTTNTTAAFAYANGVATNTTAAFALANTHATAVNATAAFAYANGVATNATAAFAYANGVATNATAAFAYANGVATNTTAAFAYANGVATNATAAFAAANQAGVVANNKVASVTATAGVSNVTVGGTATAPTIGLTAVATGASPTGGISALTFDNYGRVTSVTGSAGYVTSSGVTSVATGSGLTGGTITTTGTLSVQANNGIIANTNGVFVNTLAFLANTSGVYFNGDLFFPSGNVGIGATSTAYKLFVNGSFAANTKSFVIDHPTKPGMKLRYGSLEGPENGVYVRGKLDGSNVIHLPDYWEGLVDLNSITVQLTAIGRSQNLYVADIDGLKIYIDTENHTQPYCFYHVYAERKDVEKLVVEY